MKNQIKEVSKYLAGAGVGVALTLALTWNGSDFLDDIGDAFADMAGRVIDLEDQVEDLETDLGDAEDTVDHYSGELEAANDQIRQANYDTRALHRRVSEILEDIDGVYLRLNSEDLVVE